MTLLEFMYEEEFKKRLKDENEYTQALIVEGWNLALKAMKRQSELLEVQ